MSGTVNGGRQAALKTKQIHGQDFYKRIGAMGGGKLGVKKGFALWPKEKIREAGRLGGTISKRRRADAS